MSALVPIEKDETQIAASASVAPVDLGFSREAMERAATDFGLTKFNPEKMAGAFTLGSMLKKGGVIKVGRAYFLKGGEHLEFGAEKCREALESTNNPELVASITPTYLGFSKAIVEVGQAFARSAELDGNDDADNKPRVKPFGAGQPAGPVQVVAQQAVVNNTYNESNKP